MWDPGRPLQSVGQSSRNIINNMNTFALILAIAACIATSYGKPSGLFPAPLVAPVAPVAYTAPIITSRSAQVVQRNFNAIAAPFVAAPVAAPVFARYAYAAPAVAAPVAAPLAAPAVPAPVAAPVVAPARYAAPFVAAPAAVAAPAVAAPAFAAPALPAAPFPFYY